MPTTKANWIFISTFKHSKAAFLQAHQSWRNYSHAELLLGVSLMRDSPHLSRLALQVVKNCTEEGLCYGISLSGGRGSPQNFLSFQGTVTGSPGDLVAVPCLLTIRCHPFYFNPFPALCPYLENTKEVFLFFFLNPPISLLLQKIWPATCSHLKVTNVLHPATANLLAKICLFQGLAPVKELLEKAWNGKFLFLP